MSFFTDKIISYIAAALAVAAAAAAVVLWLMLQTANANLTACTAAKADLSAKLDVQNEAVEQLRQITAQTRANAATALAAAKVVSGQRRGQIDALQARLVAAQSIDCKDAIAEIRGTLQ